MYSINTSNCFKIKHLKNIKIKRHALKHPRCPYSPGAQPHHTWMQVPARTTPDGQGNTPELTRWPQEQCTGIYSISSTIARPNQDGSRNYTKPRPGGRGVHCRPGCSPDKFKPHTIPTEEHHSKYLAPYHPLPSIHWIHDWENNGSSQPNSTHTMY